MDKPVQPILQTERLWLREWDLDDAENLFALNNDPLVMQFTGDEPFESVDAARRFINNYTQYKKFGVGRWAMISKANEAFVGWCGLRYSPELDEYDIGFRLLRTHWNQGLATEAAKACLAYAFEVKKADMVVGRAMKQNTASIKVLSKIGLTYWKDDACGNAEGVVYKLERIPGTALDLPC